MIRQQGPLAKGTTRSTGKRKDSEGGAGGAGGAGAGQPKRVAKDLAIGTDDEKSSLAMRDPEPTFRYEGHMQHLKVLSSICDTVHF